MDHGHQVHPQWQGQDGGGGHGYQPSNEFAQIGISYACRPYVTLVLHQSIVGWDWNWMRTGQ